LRSFLSSFAASVKSASGWTGTARNGSFGAILDTRSVMLALPAGSELIAFKPNERQYEETARIKAAETPNYAHPVAAGKRVFVKDKESLTMWTAD
jgi:outer membrane protein assembly factor BamB